MKKIFISYRRSDSAEASVRLFRFLEARGALVFRDLQSIRGGQEFARVLADAAGQCDVMIALIGPLWVHATGATGLRRLEEDDDFVRREIEWGLDRNIRLVPVLIGGAAVPPASELPESIRPLAGLQVRSLGSGDRFDADLQSLADDLELPLPETPFGPASQQVPAAARRSWLERVVEHAFPRLHFRLVRRGVFAPPEDMEVVHGYLTWAAEELGRRTPRLPGAGGNAYVPMQGRGLPVPSGPGLEFDPTRFPDRESAQRGAELSSRKEALRVVRRTVRLLSGVADGGDKASARLASVNRDQQVVPDVARWLRRSAREPLILLGDPGSGKSMTLMEVGRQLASRGLKEARPPVVLFVRLAHYREVRNGAPGPVWPLVRSVVPDAHRGVIDCLDRLQQEGRLVVLFDGMDEMDRRLYGPRVGSLSQFASDHHGKVKTFFACRNNDFNPRFTHRQMVLLPFDAGQVRDFLALNLSPLLGHPSRDFAPWPLALRLLRDPTLAELSRNPQTLYLLCHYIHDHGKLPDGRRELFENHLALLARRLLADCPSPASARDGWERLAYLATCRNAGTSLELAWLRTEWGAERADATVRAGLQCGLLVLDEADDQAVRFAHHRFQEYLTACYIARAGDAGVDWARLLDTPRWQETLVSLASVQGGASPALGVVLESLREAESGPPAAPEGQPPPKWPWPAEQELRLADRVVLAAQIAREAGRDPARYPPGFLDAFGAALGRLAVEGRPTTQVKMLWCWGDVPSACPGAAVADAVNSEIDWVRAEALRVIGNRASLDPAGADLRLALAADLAAGSILRRIRGYRTAIQVVGDGKLHLVLIFAVLLWFAFCVGTFGAVWGILRLELEVLPPGEWFTRTTTGVSSSALAGWLATACFALSIFVAGRAQFRHRLVYAVSVMFGLVCLAHEVEHVAKFEYAVLVSTAGGVIASGCAAAGLNAVLRVVLVAFVGIARPAGGWNSAAPLVAKAGRFERDLQFVKFSAGAAALVAVFVAVAVCLHYLEVWVVKPVVDFLGSVFAQPAAWLTILVAGVSFFVRFGGPAWLRSRLQKAAGNAAGAFREARVNGLRWTASAVVRWGLRVVPIVWRGTVAAVRSGLGCLLFPMGVIAAVAVVAIVLVGVLAGLESAGLNAQMREQLPARLSQTTMIALILFGCFSYVKLALLLLARDLAARRNSRRWASAEAWAARVASARPEEQYRLLRETSFPGLRISPQQFLSLIERLEAAVESEPALSEYWQIRGDMERLLRQEDLAAPIGLEAPPDPPEHSPAPQSSVDGSAPSDAKPTPGPEVPTPVRSRGRLLRRLAACLVFLAAGAALLNIHLSRSRTVFFVNGLSESIEVEFSGRSFTLEPDGHRQMFVAEGEHVAITRRAGRDPRRISFSLRSGLLERFFGRDAFVVNPEAAAVLSIAGSGAVGLPGVDFGGLEFHRVPFPTHAFSPAPRNGSWTLLDLSPGLTSLQFAHPPAAWSDEDLWRRSESALSINPANVELLEQFFALAVNTGRMKRFREFIEKRFADGSMPVPWRRMQQDACGLLGEEEAARRISRDLLEKDPKDFAELHLSARLLSSAKARLAAYARANAPENGYLWEDWADAYDTIGDLRAARETCRLGRAQKSETHIVGKRHVPNLTDRCYKRLTNYEILLDLMLDDLCAAKELAATEAGEVENVVRMLIARRVDPKAVETIHEETKVRLQRAAAEMPLLRYWNESEAWSESRFFAMTERPAEWAAAASRIPPEWGGESERALALLTLGDFATAESVWKPSYPAFRAFHRLLVSIGVWNRDRNRASTLRTEAARDMRTSKQEALAVAAEALEAPHAPRIGIQIADLALDAPHKAAVLIALAQRWPGVRSEALDLAKRLTRSPLGPGPYLRMVIGSVEKSKE